jgi:RNA-directed DNA polymerase
MVIVRFADDFVVGFEHEADAQRFRDVLRKRLEEYSLSLHPDKTRLIEFGRLAADRRARAGLGKPETFKFLGYVSSALMLRSALLARKMPGARKIGHT